MDRSNVCYLVSKTYTQDALGQFIPTEVSTMVYCDIQSVTRAEWMNAGQQGLKPEWKVTMFAPDYNGEDIVDIAIGSSRVRYGVYRTYVAKDETLELYLERKVGA